MVLTVAERALTSCISARMASSVFVDSSSASQGDAAAPPATPKPECHTAGFKISQPMLLLGDEST